MLHAECYCSCRRLAGLPGNRPVAIGTLINEYSAPPQVTNLSSQDHCRLHGGPLGAQCRQRMQFLPVFLPVFLQAIEEFRNRLVPAVDAQAATLVVFRPKGRGIQSKRPRGCGPCRFGLLMRSDACRSRRVCSVPRCRR